MNTRIRYVKYENQLLSKKIFTVRGTDYNISLNTDDMTYTVNKTSNMDVASHGAAPTVNLLKIAAKKALQELGVSFKNESRLTKKDKEQLNTNEQTQNTTV